MAIVYAVKNGDWSDTTVWNTGVLPGVDDEVYANSFTVYLDQDINVASISARSTTGVSGGGVFRTAWDDPFGLEETRTISADIIGSSVTSDSTLVNSVPHDSEKLLKVIGNVVGGSTMHASGLFSYGAVDILGNVSAGSAVNSVGVGLLLDSLDPIYSRVVGDISSSSVSTAMYTQHRTVIQGSVDVDGEGSSGILVQPPGSFGPSPGNNMSITIMEIDYENKALGNPIVLGVGDGGVGSDSPDPHDVRKGIAYDGSTVGTLDVPHPNQVAFGVPTDNTVGQAAISLPQLSEITGNQISSAFDK